MCKLSVCEFVSPPKHFAGLHQILKDTTKVVSRHQSCFLNNWPKKKKKLVVLKPPLKFVVDFRCYNHCRHVNISSSLPPLCSYLHMFLQKAT